MSRNRGPYSVGSQTFGTQKAVVEHIRAIVRRTPPGAALERDDAAFVRALLSRHPRAAEKAGPGVAEVRLEPNRVWGGTPMFVLVRTDGSRTDFSFMKCLRTPSSLDRFRAACRRTVADDVLAFKRAHFERHADAARCVVCPLSGRRLGWHQVHVDHAPPWTFRRIVDAFIEREGIRPDEAVIFGTADGEVEPRLADPRLAERFRRFHGETASLRVISATENLRAAR